MNRLAALGSATNSSRIWFTLKDLRIPDPDDIQRDLVAREVSENLGGETRWRPAWQSDDEASKLHAKISSHKELLKRAELFVGELERARAAEERTSTAEKSAGRNDYAGRQAPPLPESEPEPVQAVNWNFTPPAPSAPADEAAG